ncbi:MAG: DedA family protein [Bacteroidales bacterium]
MPVELIQYVTHYGYPAIFMLVFLQEICMPNPFPSELLLMFSGYLSFKGLLSLPFVIITALMADLPGTFLLYFIFYTTGTILLKKKPKWFPMSESVIGRLMKKISTGGQLSIFIFRLIPFTRGYASVITGLPKVKPKIFLPIATISAIAWASAYVVIGNLIGPSWDIYAIHIGSLKYILLVVLTISICIALFVNYGNKRKGNRCDSDNSLASVISDN